MKLWDYREGARNEILEWAKNLSKKDRAALNQKLDVLERLDFGTAKGLRLLSGGKSGGILTMQIFGETVLRPLLCRGPLHLQREYTLLQGAKRENGGWNPKTAMEDAKRHRDRVGDGDDRWRTQHVRA